MESLKVLILDDEPKITEQLSWHLKKRGLEVEAVNTPEEAFRILKDKFVGILILDVMMPVINGLEVLERVKSFSPDTSVILMSGYGDMEMVINAMRLGAVDFIRKPFQVIDVMLAIERTGKLLQLKSQLSEVKEKHSLLNMELESNIEREFVGESEAIKKVLELAFRVAGDPDVNVLITGENGTGKEIIARVIHYAGSRGKGNFVPVNSAAIPDNLIESQFFGHKKGAFTDAKEDRKGFLEMASGGTLFLDEIGDMPLSLQAKLLRAIEERKIRRVGGTVESPIDVRIISATNKNPEEMIEENKFRMDLYHRINTIEIYIPPLRERPDDIEPLIRYFVKKAALRKNRPEPVISKEVTEKLKKYSFPGNVRELRNLVERAMILSEGKILVSSDFPLKERQYDSGSVNGSSLRLEEMEIQAIKEALHKAEYNQTLAATFLGISRDALKRKIQKHSLNIRKKLPD